MMFFLAKCELEALAEGLGDVFLKIESGDNNGSNS